MKKLMWLLFIAAVAFAFNWPFVMVTSNAQVMKMNDVQSILSGYRAAPHLWHDGLAWWHGTWIQQGIVAYRPLSAYVYWVDCWIGETQGWFWVGWVGYALFVAALVPAAWLAWRWTDSAVLTAFAVVLAATGRFVSPGQETHWLVWFPIHQELLVIGVFLLTLCCFDCWLQSGQKKALVFTWLALVVGCFSKEYQYIFPVVAFALAVAHPNRRVSLKAACLATGLMLAFVVAFACYRASILTAARNPTLQFSQLYRKPLIFCYPEIARDQLTGLAYLPCLALFWFVLAGSWLKARRRWKERPARSARWNFQAVVFNSLGGPLALFAVLTVLYFMAWQLPVVETLWVFFLGQVGQQRRYDLALGMFDFYSVWLGWKYRGTHILLAAWLCWVLSYGPVLDYIGWHYTLGPLFLRSVYYAVLAQVVLHDTGAGRLLEKLQKKSAKILNSAPMMASNV